MANFENMPSGDRKVRTQEGVSRYRLPIGSVIRPNGTVERPRENVASYARLLSLYRMQQAARRTGQYHLVIKYANAIRNEFEGYVADGGTLSKLLEDVMKTQEDKGFVANESEEES